MSMIFVRHGETALNVAQVVQPADTPLSARGQLQAERVAERLATLQVSAIVSSDLPRALETARRISARSGIAVEIDPIWRERNFGDWRGQRWLDLGFDPRNTDRLPPAGESSAVFAARVALAFAGLQRRERRAAGGLVVVTHGLVIRSLIETHLARPAPLDAAPTLGNTSVTVAAAEAPYAISVLACLQHLSGDSLGSEASTVSL